MSNKIVIPKTRPQISKSDVDIFVAYHKAKYPQMFQANDKIVLVFIRGYYLKSFGNPETNDYNVYDDACLVWSENFCYPYNANTDPSFVRHPQTNRPLAKLNCGVYRFYKGKHKNKYNALRAFPEGVQLPCSRDGKPSICQYINIHYGSDINLFDTTWSEGCLTLPKSQFIEFINLVYTLLDSNKQKTVPVILIEKTSSNRYISGLQEPIEPFKMKPEVVVNTGLAPDVTDNTQQSKAFLQEELTAETIDAQIDKIRLPIPEVKIPEARLSEVKIPEVKASEARLPEVKIEDFIAYIPQIDTAKRWLRTALAISGFSTIGAFFSGLPTWLVIALLVLLAIVFISAIVLFVKYYNSVFDYVKTLNALKADPAKNNPVIQGRPPTD